MSYILDALKRADAERERGAVPGLQSRHAPLPAAVSPAGVSRRVWLIAAAALALGGAAAGLWFWQQPDGAARVAAMEPAATRPAAPTASPAPAPLPAPIPAPAPAPARPPAPQPSVAAPRAPAPSPSAAAPAVAAIQPAAPRPAAKPPLAPPAAADQPPAKPRPEPAAKAAAPPAVAAPVPLLAELPESLRRQIPPIAISGAVYSDNPAKRLLLVNNQVLGQGSQAAPGLRLEEIQPKSSVFSYQGTRFRLAH